MKFKEYLNGLKEILREYPEVADYNVVYSSDDKSNEYSNVIFGPYFGKLDSDNAFIRMSEFEDFELDPAEADTICIN